MTESLSIAADWDPEPVNRIWYRHAEDGQKGWMVRRNGKDCIKLDRAMEELIRQMGPEWIPDLEHRPLTRMQVAQVCFEADKRLSFFLGLPDNLNKQWLGLRDETRISWMDAGPSDPIRAKVWTAIREALREHSK